MWLTAEGTWALYLLAVTAAANHAEWFNDMAGMCDVHFADHTLQKHGPPWLH